jgi:hypothetical protein
LGNRVFQDEDLVLKWDKENELKGRHTKFQNIWLAPYLIHQKIEPGMLKCITLEGDKEELPVNDQILKLYFS